MLNQNLIGYQYKINNSCHKTDDYFRLSYFYVKK
nr:MAG TPA: hypothetical protein [Caudoviricetes sp.]